MAILSTHNAIKKLMKQGFTEKQAEGITETFIESHDTLATKSDIAKIETELKWIKAIMVVILGLLLKSTFF